MNAGFFNRAKELREKQLANSASNSSGLWKFIPEKEKLYNVSFLIDLDKTAPIMTHFVKGAPSRLCNFMYTDSTECKDCQEINKFGNQNYPSTIYPLIGYVHELVGQKRESKKGKVYDENPVKLVEIPQGKKEVNWEELRRYQEEGLLLDEVWEIQRGEAGFREPRVANRKLLLRQYDPTVPEEIREEFAAKTAGEAMGLMLLQYGNCKKDHPDFVTSGIVFPTVAPASVKTNEDATDDDESLDDEDFDLDD